MSNSQAFLCFLFISICLYSCNPRIPKADPPYYIFNKEDKIKTWNVDDRNDCSKRVRYMEGELTDSVRQEIWKRLNLDESAELVILYYLHGYEYCGGMWSKSAYSRGIYSLERRLTRFPRRYYRHVHCGDVDIERYKEITEHIYDEGAYVNRQLFNCHVNCTSYAVLRKNGNWIGYLGELNTNDLSLYVEKLYENTEK